MKNQIKENLKIRLAILISGLLKFLSSQSFAFIFIAIPLFLIAYFKNFDISLIFALVVVHFISFFFVYKKLYSILELSEAYSEICKIHQEYKDLLKQKKS
jgi:hypothetical protein